MPHDQGVWRHTPEPDSALRTRTTPSTVTSSPAQQLPTSSPVSSTSIVRGTLLSSDSSISCQPTTRLTFACRFGAR